jgi:hypothetical protein
MRHPRIAAVAVTFCFAVLLTLPDTASAQHVPGGGMRGHFGGYVRGPAGGYHRGGTFMRPGRLMGTPRGMVGPLARPFHGGLADRAINRGFPSRFGVPDHRGFIGPGNGFGFFGFPRDHFGFFFFSGFGFFGGFPFFDGFFGFDGFPERVGLFRIPNHHFGFSRFSPRRHGLFGHRLIPGGAFFGWPPYFGTWGGSAYPYASAGGASARETTAVREISLGRQLAVPGIGEAGDTLVVERVSVMDVVPRAALRLTWRNSGLDAAQVSLFLADTAQGVLSAQTLRSPPFTALFEPQPRTAFVGMTVAWPDGTLSTRVVPYRSGPR